MASKIYWAIWQIKLDKVEKIASVDANFIMVWLQITVVIALNTWDDAVVGVGFGIVFGFERDNFFVRFY